MKGLLTPLTIMLVLCFTLVSCASEKGIAISTIPWPDNEETRYTIQGQGGNTTGSGTLTIVKEGESYILGEYWEMGEVKQITSIKVASDDLKPTSGTQTIVTPKGEVEINTTYTGNNLKIQIETPQGSQSPDMDVPVDAYDNDEISFLFRAIPFKQGYQATYTNVVASTGQKPEVIITVIGKEQVEAPAGLFHCWKLELKVAGQKQYMWYGVDSPHYWVKYDDGQNIVLLQEIIS